MMLLWMFLYKFFGGRYVHISVEYVLWTEFVGHKICVCSALLNFTTLFSKVIAPIFILPVVCKNSIFLHSHEAWIWTMLFCWLGPEFYSFQCTQWMAQLMTCRRCRLLSEWRHGLLLYKVLWSWWHMPQLWHLGSS